jgi:hypothetical protein
MSKRLNLPVGQVCGKRRYYNEATAQIERDKLNEYNRKHHPTQPTCIVYWCKQCGSYHVGRKVV